MNFLPDVYIECEECKGKRYNRETLEVKYKGKSIADVLDMSVEEAMSSSRTYPPYGRNSRPSHGSVSTTSSSAVLDDLSGGEAQRIKLTRELREAGDRQDPLSP